MSGSKSRVTVQIKSEEECALYTHCYTHSINLAVGDTMKVWPVLKDTIDNTYELTKLVKMSPKRDAKLHSIQWKITLVAAMKMTSLLMDLKPHHKIVLSYLMDRLYRLSQWSYQKLWWLAKVVGMIAWKLFLFGDEITHPWHHSVYTQIFLLFRHTFSSLDSFSHQQSQSRWQQSKLRSFPVLVLLLSNQFILEMNSIYFGANKTICCKTQNRWAIYAA